MANRVRNGWTEELGKGKLGREMYGEGKALGDFYICQGIRGNMWLSHTQKRPKTSSFHLWLIFRLDTSRE